MISPHHWRIYAADVAHVLHQSWTEILSWDWDDLVANWGEARRIVEGVGHGPEADQ